MFSKKINTGLIALVIGASTAFAFNAPVKKSSSSLATQWFLYNGSGISNPNNYTEVPTMPSSCEGSGRLCAILAPENGTSGKPTQDGVNSPDETLTKQ